MERWLLLSFRERAEENDKRPSPLPFPPAEVGSGMSKRKHHFFLAHAASRTGGAAIGRLLSVYREGSI